METVDLGELQFRCSTGTGGREMLYISAGLLDQGTYASLGLIVHPTIADYKNLIAYFSERVALMASGFSEVEAKPAQKEVGA